MFLEVGRPSKWPPSAFETYEQWGGIHSHRFFDNVVATNYYDVQKTVARLGFVCGGGGGWVGGWVGGWLGGWFTHTDHSQKTSYICVSYVHIHYTYILSHTHTHTHSLSLSVCLCVFLIYVQYI